MNVENLEMLAAALAGEWTPMHFDMEFFCSPANSDWNYNVDEWECGTVGCAIGHMPWALGIDPSGYFDWNSYAIEVLEMKGNQKGFLFLFSPRWGLELNENFPMDAADRIAWLIDNHEEEGLLARFPYDVEVIPYGERPWNGHFKKSGRTPGGWMRTPHTNTKENTNEKITEHA